MILFFSKNLHIEFVYKIGQDFLDIKKYRICSLSDPLPSIKSSVMIWPRTRVLMVEINNITTDRDDIERERERERDYKFIQKRSRGLNRVPARTDIFACLNQLSYR